MKENAVKAKSALFENQIILPHELGIPYVYTESKKHFKKYTYMHTQFAITIFSSG